MSRFDRTYLGACAVIVALVLLAALSGCASLKPEILCSPHTGEASVVQSISGVTLKQDIKLKRECEAFKAPAPKE